MNDALQKFLSLTRANFWDWQFFVFILFSVLLLALYFSRQNSFLTIEKPLDFPASLSGRREVWNYLLIAAVSGLLCFLLVLVAGIPVPQTHDEFALLLAADTFSHGRIANPTPFSPAHFEYFHILLKPVYAAKYPPLQGIFLAVGTLFSGHPIAGVWLSSILSSLAIYWLLRHFFSPAWALYGAFLWIFSPLNIIWCDSYWGAHAALLGGALAAGAFFRLINSGRLRYLFVWGAGIFILLNSRPFEGILLTGILFLLWLFDTLRNKKSGREFYRAGAVFVSIVAANLVLIAFYNFSITGDPLVLPYRLHHSQYHRTPLFVFQGLDAPKTDIPAVVKKLDDRWAAEFDERYKNWTAAFVTTISRIPGYLFWLTRSPFLIAFFLAGLVFSLRKEHFDDWKYSPVIFAFVLCGLFLTTFTGDRFTAPVVGIFIAVTTLAAKIVYQKSKILKLWILSLPLIIGTGFLYGMFSVELRRGQTEINPDKIGSRAELENFLKSQPGKHLLFLETADAFPADARFYVYNRADPEASEIIWAHDLSPEENAALVNRYKNRSVWRLKNVNQTAVLVKYENQSAGQQPAN
jgi:hypothetical protein